MFEALKKIMAAAEELGDVTKIHVSDWIDPGTYRVRIEGNDSKGMTFDMEVNLKFPVPVTDQTEGCAE